MIQDQSLVASKHLLVETEDKNLADPAVAHPGHGRSPLDKTGDDYDWWTGVPEWVFDY